jgi:hypothetical protein
MSLIVGDPRGILDQQLRPHPIQLLIIIIITLISCNIKLNLKRRPNPLTAGNGTPPKVVVAHRKTTNKSIDPCSNKVTPTPIKIILRQGCLSYKN